MRDKGFTFIEIIIVLVIVGILAAIAIPNFLNSIEQSRANTAQNNLLAILAGQAKFYEDYGNKYCLDTNNGGSCNGNTANNQQNINSYLHLSMANDSYFTYDCTESTVSGPYYCTAIATDGSGTVLTLNMQTQSTPPPTCLGISYNVNFNSNCQISCLSNNNNIYCPSNIT